MPPAFAGLIAAQPHLFLLIIKFANDRRWFRGRERACQFDGRLQRKVYVTAAVAVSERMQVGRRGRQSSSVNDPLHF